MNYAALRYRLRDPRGIFARTAVIVPLYALIFALPLYLGFATGSWPLATAVAVVLASLGTLAYGKLYRSAENLLLADRCRYRKKLMEAADAIAGEQDVSRLYQNIVESITKAVPCRFAALFSRDPGTSQYGLTAVAGDLPSRKDAPVPSDHPLIVLLKKGGSPVVVDKTPDVVRQAVAGIAPASLAVPLAFDSTLHGFLLLGEKLNGDIYDAEDTGIFAAGARQAALVMTHRSMLEDFRKTHEKISSAEKLASIGGLAEGVAHQINNRLNHFSMVSGELKFEIDSFMETHADVIAANAELKDTFEYLARISDSLIDNVKRTDGIVKGILNYTRAETREPVFSLFPVGEIIDLSCDLLKVKHGISDFPVSLEGSLSEKLYGIRSQVMECLYTLIENAYEATMERQRNMTQDELKEYRPRIIVRVHAAPGAATLEVADNGAGVNDDDREKLFAPFFSTKSSYKSGTGIGLYVAKRMIEENHHGRIWFESRGSEGASFFIELPFAAGTSTTTSR